MNSVIDNLETKRQGRFQVPYKSLMLLVPPAPRGKFAMKQRRKEPSSLQRYSTLGSPPRLVPPPASQLPSPLSTPYQLGRYLIRAGSVLYPSDMWGCSRGRCCALLCCAVRGVEGRESWLRLLGKQACPQQSVRGTCTAPAAACGSLGVRRVGALKEVIGCGLPRRGAARGRRFPT